MCLKPVLVNGRRYPCGKCPECRKYQSYLCGFGFEIVGNFYNNVSFLTLTISDENMSYIPVSIYQDVTRCWPTGGRHFVFYRESSAIVRRCDLHNPLDIEFPYAVAGDVRYCPAVACYVSPKYLEAPFGTEEDTCEVRSNAIREVDECSDRYVFLGTYYFAVCVSRYFQNAIKSMRQDVASAGIESRKSDYYGCSIPPFVYRACAEYGPKKGRPHFHLVIAYNDDVAPFIDDFARDWEQRYGYVVVKTTDVFVDRAAFGAFAGYTAEYTKKSDADMHFLQRFGLVPPLRAFVSLGYNKLLRSYVRTELVSEIRGKTFSELTSDELYDFCHKYFGYKYVRSNGKAYPLPQVFKLQSLKYVRYSKNYSLDVDFKNIVTSYRAHYIHTPLSLLVSLLAKHGDYESSFRDFRIRFGSARPFEELFDFICSLPEVSDCGPRYSEIYYALKNQQRFVKTPF